MYLAMPSLIDLLALPTVLSFAMPAATVALLVCSGSLNVTRLCLAGLFDMFGVDLVGCCISFLIHPCISDVLSGV